MKNFGMGGRKQYIASNRRPRHGARILGVARAVAHQSRQLGRELWTRLSTISRLASAPNRKARGACDLQIKPLLNGPIWDYVAARMNQEIPAIGIIGGSGLYQM